MTIQPNIQPYAEGPRMFGVEDFGPDEGGIHNGPLDEFGYNHTVVFVSCYEWIQISYSVYCE